MQGDHGRDRELGRRTEGVRSLAAGRSRWAAILWGGWAVGAHAHHVMDYAVPATAWQGFLSGLGHPVIGLDHLLFVIGAGVLAARMERGILLPLVFVGASIVAVAAGSTGAALPLGELWVALSLLVLGGALLISRGPARGVVTALFLVAGAVHGYALAESIVGAERTPLYGYLAGLTCALSLVASAAWATASWIRTARPALPVTRVAGISLGIAGLYFAILAALG